MKWIKYKLSADGDVFIDTAMTYSEANLEIVKKEAYNGEYTIEDDETISADGGV